MPVISIVVTLEDHALAQTQEICTDLSHHGLIIESEMPELGLIFGRCEAARLADFARIEGVAEARAEDRIDLPTFQDDTPQ